MRYNKHKALLILSFFLNFYLFNLDREQQFQLSLPFHALFILGYNKAQRTIATNSQLPNPNRGHEPISVLGTRPNELSPPNPNGLNGSCNFPAHRVTILDRRAEYQNASPPSLYASLLRIRCIVNIVNNN